MRRFIASLSLSVLTVLAIGGAVIAGSGQPDVERADGDAALLQQTEETTPESTEDSASTAAGLTPLDLLLAAIAPQTEGSSLPSSQRVILSRDPFRPVVPASTDGGGTDGGGTDGGGTDGGGTDGGGTDGGGTDGGGTTPPEGPACSGDEQETVCDGVVVTLVDVGDSTATVTVDGVSFTVAEGEEFATSFRVLSIDAPCVTLLYGDEAFSICRGVTVLK